MDAKAMISLLAPAAKPETLIKSLIAESGVPEAKWTKNRWRSLAIRLAEKLIATDRALVGTALFKDLFKEKHEKNKYGVAHRLDKRRDRIAKKAFQDAVKVGDYESPMEAANDMHVNKNYEGFSIITLRNWAADVMEPAKRGRPKGKKVTQPK